MEHGQAGERGGGATAPARFITFEGIDGAGKSTQILALADRLRGRGVHVVVTREPGGTPLGETLRGVLLERDMGAPAEVLLMFAARADHVERVIRPALAAGQWVLCDRFTDASYAYQCGGRGVPPAWLDWLQQAVHPGLAPDRTFLFDLDPAEASRRLHAGRVSPADRFESEDRGFFARVRMAYLERARHDAARIRVLDARSPVAELSAAIAAEVEPWT